MKIVKCGHDIHDTGQKARTMNIRYYYQFSSAIMQGKRFLFNRFLFLIQSQQSDPFNSDGRLIYIEDYPSCRKRCQFSFFFNFSANTHKHTRPTLSRCESAEFCTYSTLITRGPAAVTLRLVAVPLQAGLYNYLYIRVAAFLSTINSFWVPDTN